MHVVALREWGKKPVIPRSWADIVFHRHSETNNLELSVFPCYTATMALLLDEPVVRHLPQYITVNGMPLRSNETIIDPLLTTFTQILPSSISILTLPTMKVLFKHIHS